MDFLELAHKRFSVLEYDRKPVEKEKIDKLLDAALSAPTACNFQPQRLYLIQSDEDRERLNRVIPSKYYVPAAFVVCYDKKACWIRPFDGKSSGDIDASIVTTHMMMEAADLGLGSIWVMFWDPQRMKEEFSLPDHLEPVSLLIFGYPSDKACPRKGHLESKHMGDILI
ncbi:MAG: nitroreductase family protein [Oscillospiraceae bacterium]